MFHRGKVMLWANPKEIADEEIATFKRPCPTNTDLACHLLARSAGLPALKGFVVSLTPKLSDADPSSTTFGGSESLQALKIPPTPCFKGGSQTRQIA